MKRILVIQTAFIGDVVLATSLVEQLHADHPGAGIDFLLRKGNEGLLQGHPFIRKLWVWNKKERKYRNLWKLAGQLRKEGYDTVFNLQRFGASGFLTWRSGAKEKIGFDKNPFAFVYTRKVAHTTTKGLHETERNIRLMDKTEAPRPRLYPTKADYERVSAIANDADSPYITVAPASVWHTKQFPPERWLEFMDQVPEHIRVYLMGGPADKSLCGDILSRSKHPNTMNLAGELSLLQSAALMGKAAMNYVNDSAPMHLASAMNAPVTALFCSTVPAFGFGPLSDDTSIAEVDGLYCRPCGLHGRKACPEGHFRCATGIDISKLTKHLP